MVFCIVCLFASLLVSNYDLFNMNALYSLNLAFWTFLATLSSSYKLQHLASPSVQEGNMNNESFK